MLSTSKNLTFGVWGEPVNNTFLSAHLSLESVGKKKIGHRRMGPENINFMLMTSGLKDMPLAAT